MAKCQDGMTNHSHMWYLAFFDEVVLLHTFRTLEGLVLFRLHMQHGRFQQCWAFLCKCGGLRSGSHVNFKSVSFQLSSNKSLALFGVIAHSSFIGEHNNSPRMHFSTVIVKYYHSASNGALSQKYILLSSFAVDGISQDIILELVDSSFVCSVSVFLPTSVLARPAPNIPDSQHSPYLSPYAWSVVLLCLPIVLHLNDRFHRLLQSQNFNNCHKYDSQKLYSITEYHTRWNSIYENASIWAYHCDFCECVFPLGFKLIRAVYLSTITKPTWFLFNLFGKTSVILCPQVPFVLLEYWLWLLSVYSFLRGPGTGPFTIV